MGFSEAVGSFFAKYATFEGRASRSEFWYAYLFLSLTGTCLGIIDAYGYGYYSVLSGIYSVVVLTPSLAVSWRRLHDTGKSGAWYFIYFTIVGMIPLLIWYGTEGDDGDNKYGPNPLGTLDKVDSNTRDQESDNPIEGPDEDKDMSGRIRQLGNAGFDYDEARAIALKELQRKKKKEKK